MSHSEIQVSARSLTSPCSLRYKDSPLRALIKPLEDEKGAKKKGAKEEAREIKRKIEAAKEHQEAEKQQNDPAIAVTESALSYSTTAERL